MNKVVSFRLPVVWFKVVLNLSVLLTTSAFATASRSEQHSSQHDL
jgi:hypothetical protein